MGCIGRIGCLVLLAILAVAGWFTRDRWMGLIRDRGDSSATAAVTWQPLTEAAAERGRRAVESLGRPGGPVFVNLTGAELASYAVEQLSRQLPSADSIEAMVEGDRLSMRASVRLGELGGSGMLGPLAGMLGDRERMKLSGTLRVVRPGVGEFDVKEATLRDFKVPTGMIPRIMSRISRGRRPEGVSPSALPLRIPQHVGDVRVANGRVTLYKANQ
ncbi:MAG TPA: hypothetical protein VEA99_09905 [Gemmatimonadaceae bacterium]|nr:hypothetical protein [Gemmatimonadaceae bacterium]